MLTRAYICFLLAVSCGALKLVGMLFDLELVVSSFIATSAALSGTFLIAGLRRRP